MGGKGMCLRPHATAARAKDVNPSQSHIISCIHSPM